MQRVIVAVPRGVTVDFIKVDYQLFTDSYFLKKLFKKLETYDVLGFDTESSGVYPKIERELANQWINTEKLSVQKRKQYLLIANNSGLSFPNLTRTTHFIFSPTNDFSYIIVCQTLSQEMKVWKWLTTYRGKLLIHNTVHDLQIMYDRVKQFPHDYEDTMLLSKCFINNCDVWKAKVGLKDLMGSQYDPAWALFDQYEPEEVYDTKFIEYAAIDGAAVFGLWNDIQEHIGAG